MSADNKALVRLYYEDVLGNKNLALVDELVSTTSSTMIHPRRRCEVRKGSSNSPSPWQRLIDHEVAAIHVKRPPALPMAAISVCRTALLVSSLRRQDLRI